MSDAARALVDTFVKRHGYIGSSDEEWLAVQIDAFAAEQTAAEAAKHADCCVDRQEMAELETILLADERTIEDLTAQVARLRAVIRTGTCKQTGGRVDGNGWVCSACEEIRALLAEAEP